MPKDPGRGRLRWSIRRLNGLDAGCRSCSGSSWRSCWRWVRAACGRWSASRRLLAAAGAEVPTDLCSPRRTRSPQAAPHRAAGGRTAGQPVVGRTGTIQIPPPTEVGQARGRDRVPAHPGARWLSWPRSTRPPCTRPRCERPGTSSPSGRRPAARRRRPGRGPGDGRAADSAGMSAAAPAHGHHRRRPLMGLIKGTVGADFVIPCVDFMVTATTADGTAAAGRGRRLPAHGLAATTAG